MHFYKVIFVSPLAYGKAYNCLINIEYMPETMSRVSVANLLALDIVSGIYYLSESNRKHNFQVRNFAFMSITLSRIICLIKECDRLCNSRSHSFI